MDLNVGKEVAALQRMTVKELRARYAEVFGKRRPPATRSGSSSASPGGSRPWPRATCPSAPASGPHRRVGLRPRPALVIAAIYS